MPSQPDRRSGLDAFLYCAAALFAVGVASGAAIPQFREWGRIAVGPYAAGALIAVAMWRARAGTRSRTILAAAVFLTAAVLPMVLETVWRSHAGPGTHAQSEVIVTEEAAAALVDGRNPYSATYLHGPLAARPLPTKTHLPYLPGMLVFGLPRSLDGSSPFADARVWFAVCSVAVFGVALRRSMAASDAKLVAAQMAVVLPTGALLMATGGDDLPVLALMFLGLVLLNEQPGWAGLAAGVAAALKQTAWPLIPFLLLASPQRRKVATGLVLVVVPVLVPFVLWDPGAFVEDVFKFPLGVGAGASAAGTPTLGSLLAGALPGGRVVMAVVFVAALAGFAGWLAVRRPWPGAEGAARSAAIVWVLAFALAPAARFGYLVYPVNLFVWSVVLWSGRRLPSHEVAVA
jgi:hypothetical protein